MRESENKIAAKRTNNAVTLLITGATGFLGSHITEDFLKKGYSIVLLCRPGNGRSASKRMEKLFEWFDIDLTKHSNLKILEGSLEKPNFGLNPGEYRFLVDNVDEIIHCAANTSFAEKKRAEVESSNIDSMTNVLEMASQSGCYFLHHISTAYVAGKKEGPCKEEFVETHSFHNVYEETKYRAEQTAIRACQKYSIRLNIYRPSIVIGNSVTGKSIKFNALYYPAKMVHYLKNLFTRDLENNGGENAAKMGVRLDSEGKMLLPIRVEKDRNGSLNVIPVDYFVNACSAIMDDCLQGGIFHIVSNKPKCLEELIGYMSRYYGIQGLRGVLKSEFLGTPKTALEKLVDNFMHMYMPYMRDKRVFSDENTQRILGKQGITCPELSYDMFDRCLNYALEADWGKNFKSDFQCRP